MFFKIYPKSGRIDRYLEVLYPVPSPPAAHQLVVYELCQLGAEGLLTVHEEVGSALSVEVVERSSRGGLLLATPRLQELLRQQFEDLAGVRGQAGHHVHEGAKSHSARLLHEERILVGSLFRVGCIGGTVLPHPLKLGQHPLVPQETPLDEVDGGQDVDILTASQLTECELSRVRLQTSPAYAVDDQVEVKVQILSCVELIHYEGTVLGESSKSDVTADDLIGYLSEDLPHREAGEEPVYYQVVGVRELLSPERLQQLAFRAQSEDEHVHLQREQISPGLEAEGVGG